MAIQLSCGQCQGHFLAEVPDSVVACPHCGAHLQTPPVDQWRAEDLPAIVPAVEILPTVEPSAAAPEGLPSGSPALPEIEPTAAPPEAPQFDLNAVTQQPLEATVDVSAPGPAGNPAPAANLFDVEQSIPAPALEKMFEPQLAESGMEQFSLNTEADAPPSPGLQPPQFEMGEPVELATQMWAPPKDETGSASDSEVTLPWSTSADAPSISGIARTTFSDRPDADWMNVPEEPAFSPNEVTEVVPPEKLEDAGLAARAPASATAAPKVADPSTVPGGGEVRGVPSSIFWLVVSYASAMTLVAVYLLMLLRTSNPPSQLESLPDIAPIEEKTMRFHAGPEMPVTHTLRLGESRRFGSVRVTPVRITREPIEFVYFNPTAKQQREPTAPVLKLHLRFENVSEDQVFSPLDEHLAFNKIQDRSGFVRANNFVSKTAEKGDLKKRLLLYDYYKGGDWLLKGENLGTKVKPGETFETFLPSTDEGLEALSGACSWRVHFRKGYNPVSHNGVTTLIEVAFDMSEVTEPPKPDASTPAPPTAPASPAGSAPAVPTPPKST